MWRWIKAQRRKLIKWLYNIERSRRKKKYKGQWFHIEAENTNFYGGIYDDYEYSRTRADIHNVGKQKYEYYSGEEVPKNKTELIAADMPSIVPYMILSGGGGDTEIKIKYRGCIYRKLIDDDWWHYLTLNGKENVEIVSEKNFVLGHLLPIDDSKKKHKIKILLICDSLSGEILSNGRMKELMPNTSAFFEDAVYFDNCYCCADWTLPGIGTIYSGLYPISHGMLHPKKRQIIEKTIVSAYKEKGYLTSHFGSNWRCPPEYGYIKDCDRFVYVNGLQKGVAYELISNMIEHINAFPLRDHFIVLNLYDLHHLQRGIEDISIQTKQSIEMQFYEDIHVGKSVTKGFDETQKKNYELEVARLDSYLDLLYKYLQQKEDVEVVLAADHGVTFIQNKTLHMPQLEDGMTHVPLYIKGNYLHSETIREVTENTAIYDILAKMASEEKVDNDTIREIARRPYAYNELIYPGQKYLARIIDEKYVATFCSNTFVGEECVVPQPEGNEEIHIYSLYGTEVYNDSLIEEYRNKFTDHIRI